MGRFLAGNDALLLSCSLSLDIAVVLESVECREKLGECLGLGEGESEGKFGGIRVIRGAVAEVVEEGLGGLLIHGYNIRRQLLAKLYFKLI